MCVYEGLGVHVFLFIVNYILGSYMQFLLTSYGTLHTFCSHQMRSELVQSARRSCNISTVSLGMAVLVLEEVSLKVMVEPGEGWGNVVEQRVGWGNVVEPGEDWGVLWSRGRAGGIC